MLGRALCGGAGSLAELSQPLPQLSACPCHAGVYSELGEAAEAHSETAEVLRINPEFSLEVDRKRAPIKDPAALERYIAALRKAGLK